MANAVTNPDNGKQSKLLMFYFVPQGQKTVPPPEFFKKACQKAMQKKDPLNPSTDQVTPGVENSLLANIPTSAINYHDPISLSAYSKFIEAKKLKNVSKPDGKCSNQLPVEVNKMQVKQPCPVRGANNFPQTFVIQNQNTIFNSGQQMKHHVIATSEPLQNKNGLGTITLLQNAPKPLNTNTFQNVNSSFILNNNNFVLKTPMLVNVNESPKEPEPQDCLSNIKIESIVSLATENIYEPEVILNEGSEDISLGQVSDDDSKHNKHKEANYRSRKAIQGRLNGQAVLNKNSKLETTHQMPSKIQKKKRLTQLHLPREVDKKSIHQLMSCSVKLERLSENLELSCPLDVSCSSSSECSDDDNIDISEPVVSSLQTEERINTLKERLKSTKERLEKLRTEYEVN